ncbi:MAG TPA: Gfo/Idh/MocA family oxidoreductase [Planctomycetes bacterium]|nr:Gfo/Idh/MocA family oxidoreductase [Planctomycetota bacterium]
MSTIRIGIVGLGANTRLRHIPGLLACDDVEIFGVCNRTANSTRRAAVEYGITKQYSQWEDLVADPDVDAVVIGTWPYLHCPITMASLQGGKHVLTEARMAMNSTEAHQMYAASQVHPELVTQIVPSPLGMHAHQVVEELLQSDVIGDVREVVVLATNDTLLDPTAAMHWRQSSHYSGLNMLALGIVHEPLMRWLPDPVRVLAQTQTFTKSRLDPATQQMEQVGTPDSIHVLTEFPGGARGLYHLSGVCHQGPSTQIHLYGTKGTLKYLLTPEDKLLLSPVGSTEFTEIPIPEEKVGEWRVEEEFVNAIRGKERVKFNDFHTGIRYMEFTEAVAISARERRSVDLPL